MESAALDTGWVFSADAEVRSPEFEPNPGCNCVGTVLLDLLDESPGVKIFAAGYAPEDRREDEIGG